MYAPGQQPMQPGGYPQQPGYPPQAGYTQLPQYPQQPSYPQQPVQPGFQQQLGYPQQADYAQPLAPGQAGYQQPLPQGYPPQPQQPGYQQPPMPGYPQQPGQQPPGQPGTMYPPPPQQEVTQQPAAEVSVPLRCPKGCLLERCDLSQFSCDECGSLRVAPERSWGCRDCDYDLCVGCAAEKRGSLNGGSSRHHHAHGTKRHGGAPKCNKGHTMTKQKLQSLTCDVCKEEYFTFDGIQAWNCDDCSFDVCKKCGESR